MNRIRAPWLRLLGRVGHYTPKEWAALLTEQRQAEDEGLDYRPEDATNVIPFVRLPHFGKTT